VTGNYVSQLCPSIYLCGLERPSLQGATEKVDP